jgi:hypothetical protein
MVGAASLDIVATGSRALPLAEHDLLLALCMQSPTAHMATQGKTLIRTGAIPAAINQPQFTAIPARSAKPARLSRPRRLPR